MNFARVLFAICHVPVAFTRSAGVSCVKLCVAGPPFVGGVRNVTVLVVCVRTGAYPT